MREPRKTTTLRTFVSLLGLLLVCSCVSNDAVFTEGRLEKLCNESIPACAAQAACVLDNDSFYRGQFPGGQRVLIRTKTEEATIVVRFLLEEMLFAGSEMQVQVFTPDCGSFEEEHPTNVDLFEFAGDDRVIEFNFEITGRGDHLVEIFSDMSAEYLMTIEVEE